MTCDTCKKKLNPKMYFYQYIKELRKQFCSAECKVKYK